MKKITFSILLGLLSFSVICAQFFSKKPILGSGILKSENRQIDTFDKIEVTGQFTVALIKGKENEVSITADDNLIDYIVTEVNRNSLKIHIQDKVSIKRYKKLYIVVPVEKVSTIRLTGSGDIIQKYTAQQDKIALSLTGSGDMSIPLKVGILKASLSGSGDISCRGLVDELSVFVSGSGDFDGSELKSKYAKIAVSGSGDAEVYVTEKLDACIIGSGDISYKGNPLKVRNSVVGTGDITKL